MSEHHLNDKDIQIAMDSLQPKMETDIDLVIRQCLLNNMREGVVCVDRKLQVTVWNRALEQMTGMNSTAMLGNTIAPGVFRMSDTNQNIIGDAECPFLACMSSGEPSSIDLNIAGRSGREVQIEFSFHPIKCADGQIMGAMAILHDTSLQMDLQKQLTDLYMMAVLDPLTQVANRAEFERLLEEYVRSHRAAKLKCSIIICDIDFFKSINDNFGHHIGDQALISFAQLLKQFVRKHDLVARYGGEEFVILCANCDEESAVQRAEEMRVRLAKTPQSMLDGKCLTASFGVSQLSDEDDTTSFFVRADHALLKAKSLGRNRVVRADVSKIESDEIGSGADQSVSGVKWRKLKGHTLCMKEFESSTPSNVLVEKIRGTILEMDATIQNATDEYVSLQCAVSDPNRANRQVRFKIEVDISKTASQEEYVSSGVATLVRIVILRGKKSGWRWNSNHDALANDLMKTLRQYLGLSDDGCILRYNVAATSSGREES